MHTGGSKNVFIFCPSTDWMSAVFALHYATVNHATYNCVIFPEQRIVAADSTPVYNHSIICRGFKKLLDYLSLRDTQLFLVEKVLWEFTFLLFDQLLDYFLSCFMFLSHVPCASRLKSFLVLPHHLWVLPSDRIRFPHALRSSTTAFHSFHQSACFPTTSVSKTKLAHRKPNCQHMDFMVTYM